MLLLVLTLELIALYFLSRWVTQAIFTFLILIFRVRSVAVSLLLVLEFPGTVIHELSHLFTAEILGVRTGKMRLEPESIRGSDVTTGSVMVAQSDPVRHAMIGLAPLFWGMTVLAAIAYFLPAQAQYWNNWALWGLGYLLFAVSNTMYPSPTDMKGVWPVAAVMGVLFGGVYVLGVRIALTGQVLSVGLRILTTLVNNLGLVIGVNTVLLILTTLSVTAAQRVFRVRVVK